MAEFFDRQAIFFFKKNENFIIFVDLLNALTRDKAKQI